jgi:alpha-D-xyloside xylohydrolase
LSSQKKGQKSHKVEAAMRVSVLVCVMIVASATDCIGIKASSQDVRIEAYGANAVRIRAVPTGHTIRDDLVSALVPLTNISSTRVACPTIDLKQSNATITSGNLKVAMGNDGKLVFTRLSDNKVILMEKTVRQLNPATTNPPLPGFYSLDLNFEAIPGEQIYGLGQHKTGKLDNKGVRGLQLNPHNTEILIPVAHSSEGYAFLFNLPSFGMVEYNDTGSFWRADAVLQADFWVATTSDGPNHAVSPWEQLQGAYADATGHAPVYPEWTSGFWQCRNRYHNQTQVMDIAEGYLQRQYPLSLMIIDYYR